MWWRMRQQVAATLRTYLLLLFIIRIQLFLYLLFSLHLSLTHTVSTVKQFRIFGIDQNEHMWAHFWIFEMACDGWSKTKSNSSTKETMRKISVDEFLWFAFHLKKTELIVRFSESKRIELIISFRIRTGQSSVVFYTFEITIE